MKLRRVFRSFGSRQMFLLVLGLVSSLGLVIRFHLERDHAEEIPVKSILVWNHPERIETASFGIGSTELFAKRGCPVTRCRIVTDPTALPFESYDAVLFNVHTLHLSPLPSDLNYRRHPRQRFVLLTQESPETMVSFNRSQSRRFFNWTMTYRLDSDVRLLYGRIGRRIGPRDQQRPRSWNSKKLVAWMASHCTTASLRETYVRQLQKFVPVDIYGQCGHLSCPRNAFHWLSEPECYSFLEQNYKFYLSFENSLCNDYVTEKFFNIVAHDLVPVVYGGANYSGIAPPNSFIDARQFTPLELARYLLQLDSDPIEYQRFLAWKDDYIVETGVEQMARHAFCDLCRKLHLDRELRIYEGLEADWNPETQCTRPVSWETRCLDECCN